MRWIYFFSLMVLAAPSAAWPWGSVTHQHIAQSYSQHLPPEIDGLRTLDPTVNAWVMDPDYRKSSVPEERYRHYLDIDFYPEFFSGTLSHDRGQLELQYGAGTVLQTGIITWTIGEVVDRLAGDLAAQDWDAAGRTIADLCHYVGDAHVPLHATKNYDGQYTGNDGIHSRWESTMMGMFIQEIAVDPAPVTFYPDAVEAAFDIIEESWSGVATILEADDVSRTVSGGSFNSLYYQALWQETGLLAEDRTVKASRATASFVYTAWKNAGEPVIPGSTVDITPPAPPAPRFIFTAEPNPFTDYLVVRWDGPRPFVVEVYDARGTRVGVLDGGAASGEVRVWRPGRRPLGPGVFFVRLRAPGVELVRRAVYVR